MWEKEGGGQVRQNGLPGQVLTRTCLLPVRVAYDLFRSMFWNAQSPRGRVVILKSFWSHFLSQGIIFLLISSRTLNFRFPFSMVLVPILSLSLPPSWVSSRLRNCRRRSERQPCFSRLIAFQLICSQISVKWRATWSKDQRRSEWRPNKKPQIRYLCILWHNNGTWHYTD